MAETKEGYIVITSAEWEELRTLRAAAVLERERVGTLGDDEFCRRCGGENVIWAAPSPLWNKVMRGNEINAEDDPAGIVCIRCFVVLAEERGVRGQWHLTTVNLPDDLIYETPSGRVWDDARWLWVDPAADRPALDAARAES